MNAIKILQSVGLDPKGSVFSLDNEEVLARLLEFIEEWGLTIQVTKIVKKEWRTLFESYADALFTYHPENDHQERAVFLRNEEILKKYGLTSEDIARLDFC